MSGYNISGHTVFHPSELKIPIRSSDHTVIPAKSECMLQTTCEDIRIQDGQHLLSCAPLSSLPPGLSMQECVATCVNNACNLMLLNTSDHDIFLHAI